MTFADTEHVTLCHTGKQGLDTGRKAPKPAPRYPDVTRSASGLSDAQHDGSRSSDRRLIVDEMVESTLDADDAGRTVPRQERGASLLFPEPSTYALLGLGALVLAYRRRRA